MGQEAPLLTEITHQAMACDFAIYLPETDAESVEAAVTALEQLDEIEARLTIYNPASEVSAINRGASEHSVRVSQDTFELIENAWKWSERTGGAFDITAGPLVEAWGFNSRRGKKPTPEEIEKARNIVGYQHLLLDPDQSSVRFAKPGMSINMGGIGKGDALDRISRALRISGVNNFLVHGGKSSILAYGDQIPGSDHGWPIGLSHPTKPNRRLGTIRLRNQALATSGSGKQFFHHRGRRYGHVIDPRTGYPAGELLSLTVVTPLAADADACSTGFFVAGHENVEHSEDWAMPDMIAIHPTNRQDDVTIQPIGEIDWVDAIESQ